jgi:hypothetical protein
MDGVQPKGFVGETKADVVETAGEGVPKKKRKPKHGKFIDLQKQPPRPKPLVQE